jgi:hypothetical protein
MGGAGWEERSGRVFWVNVVKNTCKYLSFMIQWSYPIVVFQTSGFYIQERSS